MSFESLSKDDLFRTAVEDFGVDVKRTDSKAVILAALVEDGISWEMYLEAHPEARPVEATEPANIITSDNVTGKAENVTTPAAAPIVRTAAEPVQTNDLYLIKMERDNPYFEYRGYKFTSAHPYVVMPATDADRILKHEEGFKIATPSEAAAYYE